MKRVSYLALIVGTATATVAAALASPAPGRTSADDLVIDVFLLSGNLDNKTRGLNFRIVVEVASSSGVEHSITVRTALPVGLSFGIDAPDPSEGCTGNAPVVCTVMMQANPVGTIGFGWSWDIIAERAGFYEITATVESDEPDPDLSNNSDTFRFEVVATQPPPEQPPPAVVAASAVKLSPPKPKAGSLVSATVRVTAGGTPIRPGALRCPATIRGAKLAGAARTGLGTATCSYRPPKTAKGKTLRGAVAFTARGKRFTKRFSAVLG